MNTYRFLGDVTGTPHPDPNTEQQVHTNSYRYSCLKFLTTFHTAMNLINSFFTTTYQHKIHPQSHAKSMTNCLQVTLWLLLWVQSAHDAPLAAIAAKVASHGETAAACIELDTPAPVRAFNPQPADLVGTKAAPAAGGRGALPLDASDLPTELSQAAPPPTVNMAVEVGAGRIITDSPQPARRTARRTITRAEATKNSATSAAGLIDQVCRRGGLGGRARPSGEMYRATASSSPPPLTTTTTAPKQAVRVPPALVVNDVARTLSHHDGTAKMTATTAEQRDKVRPHALSYPLIYGCVRSIL
jgi:hypothetical protein